MRSFKGKHQQRHKYLAQTDAEQFERDFYLLYFSTLTLPEDVAAITGVIGPGIALLPKLGSKSGRVFWSGGEAAKSAATAFAKANGLKTLEMTVKGRILETLTKLTSYKTMKPLWENASGSIAKGAEGSINVFQNAAEGVRLASTWRNIEYPILKDNVNLIFHDVFK